MSKNKIYLKTNLFSDLLVIKKKDSNSSAPVFIKKIIYNDDLVELNGEEGSLNTVIKVSDKTDAYAILSKDFDNFSWSWDPELNKSEINHPDLGTLYKDAKTNLITLNNWDNKISKLDNPTKEDILNIFLGYSPSLVSEDRNVERSILLKSFSSIEEAGIRFNPDEDIPKEVVRESPLEFLYDVDSHSAAYRDTRDGSLQIRNKYFSSEEVSGLLNKLREDFPDLAFEDLNDINSIRVRGVGASDLSDEIIEKLKSYLKDSDPEVSSDTNNVVTIRLNQLVINFIN
jgi:hypothetical protein